MNLLEMIKLIANGNSNHLGLNLTFAADVLLALATAYQTGHCVEVMRNCCLVVCIILSFVSDDFGHIIVPFEYIDSYQGKDAVQGGQDMFGNVVSSI